MYCFCLDSCLSDAEAGGNNLGGYTDITDASDEDSIAITQGLFNAVKNHLKESNRLTSMDGKIIKIYRQVRYEHIAFIHAIYTI